MKTKTRLKIRLFGKLVTFALLLILVTPATYQMTAIAVQVTYQFFWTTLIMTGGALGIKALITSMLADYRKIRRKRK